MIFLRRASYNFKVYDCNNLWPFDFFQLPKYVKGHLDIFSIDISFRCLEPLIGLINSDNLVIFKFRNPKCDLKDNLVNN